MLKTFIKHLFSFPLFLISLLYGFTRKIISFDTFKLFLKNSFTSIFCMIYLRFKKKTEIIYKGKLDLDFLIMHFSPVSLNADLIIEIYPLESFKDNKQCHGKWIIPIYIKSILEMKQFNCNNQKLKMIFPDILYSSKVYDNKININSLENGKYIGFIKLSIKGKKLLTITRLFKFYNFNRSLKKKERTPLDRENLETYNFLFSKPFSKNYKNFESVWHDSDEFAHIKNFNIYAFNFISILSRLNLKPGSNILDLGAGSCWTSEWFSKMGYNTIAYDISLQTLAIGNNRISNNSNSRIFPKKDPTTPDFTTICGDSTILPFSNGQLDAVIIIETLHHVPDYLKVISEGYRVLKNGGRLILLEPGSYHSETPEALLTMKQQAILESSLNRKELRNFADSLGFKVKEYLMPANTYTLPRSDSYYYHGYLKRLYGNVYDWFIRLLEIPFNMDGNIYFIFEKDININYHNSKGGNK